jgi:hypothetical protein
MNCKIFLSELKGSSVSLKGSMGALLLVLILASCGSKNGASSPAAPVSVDPPAGNTGPNDEKAARSPPAPPSASPKEEAILRPAAPSFVAQVQAFEERLKPYGVHFNVEADQALSDFRSSETVVKVSMVAASASDLRQLGLKPEDRDAILGQMSELWDGISANSSNDSSDRDLKIATMKVRLVRGQFMVPKVEALYHGITAAKGESGQFKFKRDDRLQFSLWNEASAPRAPATNAEAAAVLASNLELDRAFKAIKHQFLEGYIEERQETRRLNHASLSPYNVRDEWAQEDFQLQYLQIMKGAEFLNAAESAEAADLKQELASLLPELPLDSSTLKARNAIILKRERSQRLQSLKSATDAAMERLALKFIGSGDALEIDPHSLAEARVREPDYAGVIRPAKESIQGFQNEYAAFLQVYGQQVEAPAGEAEIVRKAKLALAL